MDVSQICPLTGQPATVKLNHDRFSHVVRSEACGVYEIGLTLIEDGIDRYYPNTRHILAAIARQRSDEEKPIFLHEGNVEKILDSVAVPNGPLEQIDEIVKYIRKKTPHFGADVWIDHRTEYPVAFARNESEFASLLREAEEIGYIKLRQSEGKYLCSLAREGWKRIDELRRMGRDSNKAFVAMSFKKDDPTLMDAWREGIQPALDKTGWKPIRMDLLEHNEKIDDRMIAEIRRSGLLVADLTGHRQNVYFEAGFAMGLGIPVIYTCRESDAESVHFDMRQYKYIAWTDGADLRQKLRQRIEATGLAKTLRENAGEN